MAEDKSKDITPKEEMKKEEETKTEAKAAKKSSAKKSSKKTSPKKSGKKKTASKKSAKKSESKPAESSAKPEPKKEAPKREEKPITFTEKKAKKSGGSGMKMFAVLVVLVLGGLAAAAFYQAQQAKVLQKDTADHLRQDVSSEVSFLKEKLQHITAQLDEQRKKAEEEKKTDYVNAQAGISFAYTTEMGEVREAVIPSEDDENPQPTGLTITFSANPDIWLTAAAPLEDADTNAVVYRGGEDNLRNLCADPLAITEDGYCDFTTVMGQETIERITVLREDGRVTNVVKTVPLNINGQFTGLAVNVSLGLPPVEGRNLFAPTDSEDTDAAVEEFLRNIIKEDQLSLITRQNLEAYEMILSTLQ